MTNHFLLCFLLFLQEEGSDPLELMIFIALTKQSKLELINKGNGFEPLMIKTRPV